MAKVKVVKSERKRRGKKCVVYILRWKDPVTGKAKERVSKGKTRADALTEAGSLEFRLNELGETVGRPATLAWGAFVQMFRDEEMAHVSNAYLKNFNCTISKIDGMMGPKTLQTVATDQWVQLFRKRAQETGVSDSTIHKYFQHLKTMLRFAANKRLAAQPNWPKLRARTGASRRHMKGRPITTEEYERMLEKAPTESMRHLLEGLWLSGLRLGEALALTWNPWSDGIRIEVQDNGDLMLQIDSEDQKNRQVSTYPVVDEFADFLRKHRNDGLVFEPSRRKGPSCSVNTVSKWIKEIGQAANVKTDVRQGKPIWAGAHDLRRAFGSRWAATVRPQLLQRLMRHEDIETTMKFYVGQDAQRELELIREAVRQREQGKRSDRDTNDWRDRGNG